MVYETFCIACIAAPLALVITNSNSKSIDLTNFDETLIIRKRKINECILYISIISFIISFIIAIYSISGGCDECS